MYLTDPLLMRLHSDRLAGTFTRFHVPYSAGGESMMNLCCSIAYQMTFVICFSDPQPLPNRPAVIAFCGHISWQQ